MIAAAKPASASAPALALAFSSSPSNFKTRVVVCGVFPAACAAARAASSVPGSAVLPLSLCVTSRVMSASPPDFSTAACSKKWSFGSGSMASHAACTASSDSSLDIMRRHAQKRSNAAVSSSGSS